ncbi:MAG: CRISPR-associated helicase Cas3' [Pyrinomonadaceae bacterium]
MDDILLRFWAKTSHDPDKAPNAYHPLICHMIDVACVAAAMWDAVLPDVTKRRLAKPFGLDCESANCTHKDEYCRLTRAGRVIAFLAGLHDLGKCSPPFALRGRYKSDGSQTQRLCALYAGTDCDCDCFESARNVPHGFVTALTLPEILHDRFGVQFSFAKQLSEIIGGHHGIFATVSDLSRIGDYPRSASIGGPTWDRSRKKLVDVLSDLLGVRLNGRVLSPNALDKSAAMILAGFVSVADWIGSNTDHFRCGVDDFTAPIDLDLAEYLERSRQFADQAINDLGWNSWPKNTAVKEFDELFDFGNRKRDLQNKAIEIARTVTGPGIFIVEALMGEGKTETAMYLADHFNATLGTRGIYFALPTQATSDQMFGRISAFLKNRFEETGEFVNLILQHGHSSLNDEFSENVKNFQRIRNVYADNEEIYQKHSNVGAAEWFTYRRRGLLAPFGVGTIDQILLAALQTKHVFVRLFGLAHKTVVIDEVHAYDAYMSTLLERLLEWLGSLGSPVVILSATLPKHRRTELLKAYLKGAGQEFRTGDVPIAVGDEDVYPRISYAFAGMPEKEFRIRRLATSVENTRRLGLEFRDDDKFVAELKEKLSGGGCAAIICNTVRRAQKFYDLLKGDAFFSGNADDGEPKLDLLHSGFRLKDRQLREKRALLRFGKEGSSVPFTEGDSKVDLKVRRPDLAVLISTQIIEQSLDLDFDIMVSDLAPADLLLQRAGRLQRHRRDNRPAAFVDPGTGKPAARLWVLRPPLDGNGEIRRSETNCRPELGDSGLIYDHHVLLRSWFALRTRYEINLPSEVEEVIEKIYGDGVPAPDADISEYDAELLRATRDKYLSDLENEKQIARTRYINHPRWNGRLGELLLRPKEEDSPELHPDSQAMTRLVEPTVKVACLWENDGRLYTDETYSQPIDLTNALSRSLQKEVILNSVNVSNRSVVFKLFDLPIPDAFQLSPLLRRHRYLVFGDDCKAETAGHVFELHPEKGLLIRKKEEL